MTHLRTLEIDRHLAGVASSDESRAVEAHVSQCAECAERLRAESAARAAFLEKNPPEIRARQLTAKPVRRPLFVWPILGVAAAAAGLLLWVRPVPTDPRPPELAKGGPAVAVFMRRPGAPGTSHIAGGATVRSGDQLQLRVDPAGFSEVALFDIGAAGRVTEVMRLHASGAADLPRSLVVDGSVEPELLLVVFSHRPVDPAAVAEAARAAVEKDGLERAHVSLSGAETLGIYLRKEKLPK